MDKELWLVVPMGDEIKMYDLEGLAPMVDHFVAILYDENGESDAPGPIASQDWLEGWLQVIKGYGDPSQWIGAIGAYGYDWSTGSKKAEAISFQDAMSRASYAGIQSVSVAKPSYNAQYSYQEPFGDHTVWFLDAISFINHLRAIRNEQLGGIAIERLGREDPQIWDALAMPNGRSHPRFPEHLAKKCRLRTRWPISATGPWSPWMTPRMMAREASRLIQTDVLPLFTRISRHSPPSTITARATSMRSS